MMSAGSSQTAGYLAAVFVPVAITVAASWLRLPPFIFEHVIVLLVVGVAIPWGLGLSIAAHVVALHGGTVQAASDGLGKGSEFTVRLPLPDPG